MLWQSKRSENSMLAVQSFNRVNQGNIREVLSAAFSWRWNLRAAFLKPRACSLRTPPGRQVWGFRGVTSIRARMKTCQTLADTLSFNFLKNPARHTSLCHHFANKTDAQRSSLAFLRSLGQERLALELGFPGASAKEPTCQRRRHERLRFNPWVRKIPWRRKQQPTPGFLPENPMDRGAWWVSHRPGGEESDTTEATWQAGNVAGPHTPCFSPSLLPPVSSHNESDRHSSGAQELDWQLGLL